jgi:molybdenum cofactor biosynthesis enzyme MoaA
MDMREEIKPADHKFNEATQYSCDWLEGGLTFNLRRLHVCCVSHHKGKGWPRYCDYDGGAIPEAVIRQVRQEIKDKLNTTGEPRCAGCPRLRRKKWGQPTHLVNLINFSHFKQCNLRCNYCYLQRKAHQSSARIAPYDVLPVLRSLIDQGQLAPDAIVYWGGGEPVLLKHFDEIVDLLAQHGTSQGINTNGTVYSPTIYRHLCHNAKLRIVISLDAGSRETFMKIKGVDVFDKVCENLKVYAAGGRNNVSLKIVFTNDNANSADVRGILQALAQTKVPRLILDVDTEDSSPNDRVIQAMAELRRGALRQGVNVVFGMVGLSGFNELNIRQRVETLSEEPSPFAINKKPEAPLQGDASPTFDEAIDNALDASRRGQATEVQNWLAVARKLTPHTYDQMLTLGSVNLIIGEITQAVDCFANAIRLKPDLAAGHSGRAVAV